MKVRISIPEEDGIEADMKRLYNRDVSAGQLLEPKNDIREVHLDEM